MTTKSSFYTEPYPCPFLKSHPLKLSASLGDYTRSVDKYVSDGAAGKSSLISERMFPSSFSPSSAFAFLSFGISYRIVTAHTKNWATIEYLF